jgi:transcriptional regulator with XRE-family HTH domain
MAVMESQKGLPAGQELRDRRVALGLSQGQLAALAGCDRGTVAQWEARSRNRRPAPVLVKIAKALRELEE